MSFDLRSCLDIIKQKEGELVHLNTIVDSDTEISGIYRYLGSGGTTMRPTKPGPALMCNNIKNFPDTRVLIGLLSTRKRIGYMLGCAPEKLGVLYRNAFEKAIAPVKRDSIDAPCQEIVKYASDPDFDIFKILPAPRNTEEDAGPYITMGVCYATDPETKENNITIHRICLQKRDELTMCFAPGRHLDMFRKKAEDAGKPLPISVSIGVDPAIVIATCFQAPATPRGYDELCVAGGVRGEAVEMVKCKTIDEYAIANAEFVIEGELLPGVRMPEDLNTGTGKAMPEFTGYEGPTNDLLPVIKVKAVTYRPNPIIQTCIGCSEEHVNMAGIPMEASVLSMTELALPGLVRNVCAHPSGGGKYMAVLQIGKREPKDQGRERQAALLAFSSYIELKHVILVDEDVDPFDTNDVMWALNTRFQADIDLIRIPNVRFHALDPTSTPEYNAEIRDRGITCKAIFDCTVPYAQKARFKRARFSEVDMTQYNFEPAKSHDLF